MSDFFGVFGVDIEEFSVLFSLFEKVVAYGSLDGKVALEYVHEGYSFGERGIDGVDALVQALAWIFGSFR